MEPKTHQNPNANAALTPDAAAASQAAPPAGQPPHEIGGGKRALEPTRYGDWELNGKCVDF